MKRVSLCAFCLFLIFTLSGCYTFTLNSFTEVHENGSGSLTFLVGYDDTLSQYVGQSLISPTQKAYLKENGVILSSFYKDGLTYEQFVYYFTPPSPTDGIVINNEICTATLERNSGLKSDLYTLNIVFNQPFINGLTALVDDLAIETLSTHTYSGLSPIDYLKELPIQHTISVPGEVLTSNATTRSPNNTPSWGYKLGQIEEGTTLSLTYEIAKPIRYNIIRALIFFLALVIIFSVMLFIHKRTLIH